MTDDELRQALRGTLEAAPVPPPMSSARTLQAARRSLVRLRVVQFGVASVAAVAVLALASTLIGLPAGGGGFMPAAPPPDPNEKAAEPWPTGPDGKPQQDRTARAGVRHDAAVRLLNELIAVAPAGYTVPTDSASKNPGTIGNRNSQANFDERIDGVEIWGYLADIAVRKDDRTGRLLAEVHTAGNRLAGEPCVLAQQFWGMKAAECSVVSVGEHKVGVVTRPADDNRIDQWAAYKYPDGVVVFVGQSRHRGGDTNGKPLTDLPFTPDQLAALAVDQRLRG